MQLLVVGTRDQSDNDGGHRLTRVSGDEARLSLRAVGRSTLSDSQHLALPHCPTAAADLRGLNASPRRRSIGDEGNSAADYREERSWRTSAPAPAACTVMT